MKNRKYHAEQLRVGEEADSKEIRRAYRQQALLRHPDKHGGSAEAKADFQALHNAYEYLLAHPYAPKEPVAPEKPSAPTTAPIAAAKPVIFNKYFFIATAGICCFFPAIMTIWNKPKSLHREDTQLSDTELANAEIKPCHYNAVLNGEKVASFSDRASANADCMTYCRSIKEKSEGGGVECFWGDTVILKEEGEIVNLCSVEWSVGLHSDSAQQLNWKTKQGCVKECSFSAEAQKSASVQCRWDGVLVAEHFPQVREAARQPAQVAQQPAVSAANRSIFSNLEPVGGRVGKVERFYGLPESKEIQRAGKKLPANEEDTVMDGDILETKESSNLDIRLDDESLIRLGANTRMKVGFDQNAKRFSFLLEMGIVRVLRARADPGKMMEWFTPEAALRCQSGEFFLSRDADGDVDAHVASGEVEFGGAGQAFQQAGEFVKIRRLFYSFLKRQKSVPVVPEKFELTHYLNQLEQTGQPMAAAQERKAARFRRVR